MKQLLASVLSVLLLLTLCACAATRTKTLDSWMDQSRTAPLQKALIIAVSEQAYLRQQAENVLSNQLRARGVEALPSFKVYPELGKKTPRQEALAKVKALGVESVITLHPLDKDVESNEQYSRYYFSASGIQSDGWHTYYTGTFIQASKVTDITYYRVAINIFDVESSKPFWRSLFQVRNSKTNEDAINQFMPTLVEKFDQSGLLPKK